jgi:N-acetyl-anhydromuramyl-L-alanine amidase AmpD
VKSYGGFEQSEEADTWVAAIYTVIRDGVDQEGILIREHAEVTVPYAKVAPSSPWVDSPNDIALGKPNVTWAPSSNYVSNGIGTPKYIVIHTTEGEFNGAVSWLRSRSSGVSAHFVIRSSDGFVKQLVKEKDRAWHASCWNSQAIGIEHEAFMARPTKYFTNALYNTSAKLVSYLTRKYGIPRTNVRIIGHNFWQSPLLPESGLKKCNTHTDPGNGWDWTRYLGLVRSG